MKRRKYLVMNGPNLDMLGQREPDIYGRATLSDLEDEVRSYAADAGVEVAFFQSNSEAKLIGSLHKAQGAYDGIVYNPGAHTHYSYALRDAVGSIDVPVVEVHLSDIDEREPFRRISVIAPACVAQVRGLGVEGYFRALDVLADRRGASRLGEGYEMRADASSKIIVSGELSATAGSVHPEDALGEVLSGYSERVAALDVNGVSVERREKVRAAYERAGLSALLVRDTSNIYWMTGFDGVFDEERAHALLLTGERTMLHTDSRYVNAVRQAAARTGSDIALSDERLSHARFSAQALHSGDPASFTGKLGIEDSITYAEFVKMVDAFGTANLSPTSDLVLGLRAVKDEGEIMRLRAAQAVTDAAFSHIIGFIRPGMTERGVQLELEDYLVRHGGGGLAFRSIVATGANGADPHAIAGDARLEAGQCVVLDFGARALGYCSDMTRTVFLGRPQGKMAAAWETLRCANETVESLLRPGVTGAAAHAAAEAALEEGGFGGKMGHGLGHGVGIDVHELPVLNPRNDVPLEAGNVVTVEPGIYLPGEFGMRLEDCGVVTDGGFDVFTRATHEMVIL